VDRAPGDQVRLTAPLRRKNAVRDPQDHELEDELEGRPPPGRIREDRAAEGEHLERREDQETRSERRDERHAKEQQQRDGDGQRRDPGARDPQGELEAVDRGRLRGAGRVLLPNV
jgi:hypothetical protein